MLLDLKITWHIGLQHRWYKVLFWSSNSCITVYFSFSKKNFVVENVYCGMVVKRYRCPWDFFVVFHAVILSVASIKLKVDFGSSSSYCLLWLAAVTTSSYVICVLSFPYLLFSTLLKCICVVSFFSTHVACQIGLILSIFSIHYIYLLFICFACVSVIAVVSWVIFKI